MARHLLIALIIVVTASLTVSAQVIPGLNYAGSMDGYYQSWEITEGDDKTEVNQLVVPVRLFLPFSDKMDVRIATSYASFARSIDGGGTESVSGLTDVQIQGNYAFVNRRLLLGVVVNVPAGGATLDGTERSIVSNFVSPDLSVRANRLGEGFGGGGTVSFAAPLSSAAVLSLGAGLIARGGYETQIPTAESAVDLKPGIVANGSVGIDFFTGSNHLHLSSTFSYFGTEQLNSADYYQIGPEVAIVANYGLAYARSKGLFRFGLHQIIRLSNSNAFDGEFGTETLSTNGSYLAASVNNEYALSELISVDVSALVRLVGKNDYDSGDATVFEGGLGLGFLATEGVLLSIGGRYISGSGTGFTGLDREIKGFEGMFGITAQLPG
jgi:hypothetical protein